MGANMTPMLKNRGRTVLGVKMGLGRCFSIVDGGWRSRCHTSGYRGMSAGARKTYCHAFRRCCRNAVSEELLCQRHWLPRDDASKGRVTGFGRGPMLWSWRVWRDEKALTRRSATLLLIRLLLRGIVRVDGIGLADSV